MISKFKKRSLILFIIFFISNIFVFNLFSISQIHADDVTVTATIATDSTDPSTPVLISPANNSYVTVSTPTFVWQESTDNIAMSHYKLVVNGDLLFDNIPLTATENSSYTLTYDAGTDQYSLTPKSGLSDGSHTWKIIAVDWADNSADSATWTVIIDTLAPSFVLSQIGEVIVSISAADPGTIPSSPIELAANEPLLIATGEANSSVALAVITPGDPDQNYSNSIDGTGSWSQQLGILQRDTVITLNFIITDLAGNVSVLSDLEIIIPSGIATPTPSPTLSPSPSPSPSISPTPGVTPSPSPSLAPLASPSPSPPVVTLPVIPPREIAAEIIQEVLENLPEPIKIAIQLIPEPVKKAITETARAAAPISAAIVVSAIPITSAIAIASQFGGSISPQIILKIFQAIGLLPIGKPQGIVFNSITSEPVPFALLTITGQNKNSPVTETVVTDVYGVYKGVKLEPGIYQLNAMHTDFTFPTHFPRPPYLSIQDYYMGETFKAISERQKQLFLIPMDSKKAEEKKSWKSRLRLAAARLSRMTSKLAPFFFVVSLILAIFFPSIINYLITFIYFIIVLVKAVNWLKTPLISGLVTDDQNNPLANAVIRLSNPENNELVAVMSTDKKGKFKIFAPPSKYQISVNLAGYVWYEEDAVMSFYDLDASGPQKLVINMQPVEQIYEGMF